MTAQSDNIAEISAALVKAQAAMTAPVRNRTVKVKTKTSGTYQFNYTTLDSLIDHVRKPLTDNGLWFLQPLAYGEGGKYKLVTKLVHVSGQWITSETPLLVEEATNQAFGSALTYMRRYALGALLGLASEEDDDANGADGHSIVAAAELRLPPAAGVSDAVFGMTPKSSPKIAAAQEPAAIDSKPHKIEWRTGKGLGSDATNFGQLFVSAISAAQTADEISEWERENKDAIVEILSGAPKLGALLKARTQEHYGRVRGEKGAA